MMLLMAFLLETQDLIMKCILIAFMITLGID